MTRLKQKQWLLLVFVFFGSVFMNFMIHQVTESNKMSSIESKYVDVNISSTKNKKVTHFLTIAKDCNEAIASTLLSNANWNVQNALEFYFKHQIQIDLVAPVKSENHSNVSNFVEKKAIKLFYSFNITEWISQENDMPDITGNISCNEAVFTDENGKQRHFPQSTDCCSSLYDNKYLQATYNDKFDEIFNYNSFYHNDFTICDFLLLVSNKSIMTVGDSVAQHTFNGFIHDLFEKTTYICQKGYITNIMLYRLENPLKNKNKTAYMYWYNYQVSFFYHQYSQNIKKWFASKHVFTWSRLHIYQMKPSSVDLLSSIHFDSDNFDFKFKLNKQYIDYEQLDTNITSWNKKITPSFSYFMHKIKGYDSVIVNIGPHYNLRKKDDNITAYFKHNKYKYVLNFIANILENDMKKNTNHVHIWRMTFPSHFGIPWWAAQQLNETCVQNTDKRFETNAFEFDIFQKCNYSIPVIDYFNVLKSRGFLHMAERLHDCLHWCSSNRLWKPFLFLLSKIYNDYGWNITSSDPHAGTSLI